MSTAVSIYGGKKVTRHFFAMATPLDHLYNTFDALMNEAEQYTCRKGACGCEHPKLDPDTGVIWIVPSQGCYDELTQMFGYTEEKMRADGFIRRVDFKHTPGRSSIVNNDKE